MHDKLKNIVHCCSDLKCENILLDAHNNLKISDFGFARIMNRDDISKTFCGSAAYAAPEILQGIPYTGHAYDIWSIGVILYIMVSRLMCYFLRPKTFLHVVNIRLPEYTAARAVC